MYKIDDSFIKIETIKNDIKNNINPLEEDHIDVKIVKEDVLQFFAENQEEFDFVI